MDCGCGLGGFISSAIVHRFVLTLDMLDADIRNGIDIYTVAAGSTLVSPRDELPEPCFI